MRLKAAQAAGGASPLRRFDAGLLAEFAPAKINLTLEIKGRRGDGYHEIESLVCFADFGDRLEFSPDRSLSLSIEEPFASGLGSGTNLVERAVHDFAAAYGTAAAGAFHLVKRIPVAAGLGGGSADAAATLRLLAKHHGRPEKLAALIPLARGIGADVPCCLFSRAALMTGVGETLHPLPEFAPIPAILLNPMLPLATRDVFRALAAGPLRAAPETPVLPRLAGLADVVAYTAARSNDLEGAARQLLPVIGDMLAMLEALPGSLMSRLSGSGPTCFGVFAKPDEAEDAAARVVHEHPEWWAQSVMLS